MHNTIREKKKDIQYRLSEYTKMLGVVAIFVTNMPSYLYYGVVSAWGKFSQ